MTTNNETHKKTTKTKNNKRNADKEINTLKHANETNKKGRMTHKIIKIIQTHETEQ